MINEMIHEQLRIATFSSPFRAEMSQDERIVMFYDKSKDIVFINKDSELYESCVKLAKMYLTGDSSVRIYLKENFIQESLKECCCVLDQVIIFRSARKYHKILRKQEVGKYVDNRELIHLINEIENSKEFALMNIFNLGYIMGKQDKRKKDI